MNAIDLDDGADIKEQSNKKANNNKGIGTNRQHERNASFGIDGRNNCIGEPEKENSFFTIAHSNGKYNAIRIGKGNKSNNRNRPLEHIPTRSLSKYPQILERCRDCLAVYHHSKIEKEEYPTNTQGINTNSRIEQKNI